MAVGALFTHGSARIAVIGSAHTVAQVLGAIVLVVLLGRRTGQRVVTPVVGLIAAISALAGVVAWLGARVVLDGVSGRVGDLTATASMAVAGGLIVVGLDAAFGVRRRLTERLVVDAEPIDEDAVPAGGFS